jgi:hypothetical protein
VRAPSEKYTKKKNKHANEKNVQLAHTIPPSFGGAGEVGFRIKTAPQSLSMIGVEFRVLMVKPHQLVRVSPFMGLG